jgi:hypothetical protein
MGFHSAGPIAPDYAPDGKAHLFIMTAPNEFEWFEWQIIA